MRGPIIEKLFDFRQTAVPEKLLELKVSREAVEQMVQSAAERFLTIEPVSDGIQAGDIVALDTPEGKRLHVNVGLGLAGEPLEEALLGLKTGEQAGAWGRVASVKRRMIPAFTDELAAQLGQEGVSSAEEYRDYAVRQIAGRLKGGKMQALVGVVFKTVSEGSVLRAPDMEDEDYRLLYESTWQQLEAMAAQGDGDVEKALAQALHMEGQSPAACRKALAKQVGDMTLQAAIGRLWAQEDGTGFSRADAQAQFETYAIQTGGAAPTEAMLDTAVIQMYQKYFQQKVLAYYDGRFHTAVV